MSFIVWILLGGIAGWLASLIMKSNEQQGLIMDVIVGIVGALIGGTIMDLLGYGGVSGLNLYSIGVAMLGAIILIWLLHLLTGRTQA